MKWHCLGRLDPGRRDALETRAKRVKDAPAKMREKKDPLIERAGWLPWRGRHGQEVSPNEAERQHRGGAYRKDAPEGLLSRHVHEPFEIVVLHNQILG
jgi:hypothetical protein